MHRPHPATLLLLWMLAVWWAVGQGPDRLAWLVPAVCLAALRLAGPPFRRLLWRSRWLFLAIVACLGWLTPGQPVAGTGLSIEGADAALEQVGRLLLVMAAVSLLLRVLDRLHLVEAIRLLALPLPMLGIDRDRVAIRLALTLRYLDEEGAARRIRSLADIDALLERSSDSRSDAPMVFEPRRLALSDLILMMLAMLALAGWAVR